jgi:hypothetical protein
MFGCRSLEIFWKNMEFFNSQIFAKKFGNLSSEKSSDINQSCMSILKILKKLRKVLVFESKNPVFGVKKFGNRVFQTFGNFGNCSILKFPKITTSKTAKNSFRLENQLESSVKS